MRTSLEKISPGSDLVPVPGIKPGQEKTGWTEKYHLMMVKMMMTMIMMGRMMLMKKEEKNWFD